VKTTRTPADVDQYVAAIADPVRRAKAEELIRALAEVTGAPPVMWGASIVGRGQYHYRYASQRDGDWFVLGFAVRKQNLTLYLPGGAEQHRALLNQLASTSLAKAACI
jgi:hypothetical protein